MMCSVGIVANLMLLIAFVKNPLKCFRNSATYLVGNLALSDLFCNVLFMVNISLSSEHEIAYPLFNISFYSSMWTIFSIALDRFLMITYPFKHRILMSDKKMGVWIVIIWFLSCIHPLKMIFVPDKFDSMAKLGAGSVLIILTGLLYSRTYFTLRKQNRSMVGMKGKFSSMRNENTANKSISSGSGTLVMQIGNTQNKNQRSETQSERAQSYRVRSQSKRAQIQDERTQIQDDRVQSRDGLVNNQADRAQMKGQHAQSQNTRDVGENDCGENRDRRAQIHRDIQDSSKTSVTRKEVSLQNSSSKTQKKLQSVNNAKEQKFLNTIIIIACIAVATVLVGTTYAQLSQNVLKERSEMGRILRSVCFTILCLNFAVNPFVYYLRLKQYQKTFQMVYGCKF